MPILCLPFNSRTDSICEQPVAVSILRGAPDVRILATSREPLRAEGEHRHLSRRSRSLPDQFCLVLPRRFAFRQWELFVDCAAAKGWCSRLVPNAHGSQSAYDDGAIDPIAITDHVTRSSVPRKSLGDLACDPLTPGPIQKLWTVFMRVQARDKLRVRIADMP